jgi:D-3-phosphoglycerate dehydrogenase / 2-oxoglutarate reductase
MPQKPLVLLPMPLHPDALQLLQARAEVRVLNSGAEDVLLAHVQQAAAIILNSGRVTRHTLEAAPHLRIVARNGAGYDNVDIQAARERGVVVTNTPEATIDSVAEHTVGLMLAVTRRITLADRMMRAGERNVLEQWCSVEPCGGFDLQGRTLGVIGLGRIGRRVAGICRHGFGMQIVAYDPFPPRLDAGLAVRLATLDEALAQADVVTLHVPLAPSTIHMIDTRALDLMRPGAFLINASRGPVVDEVALAAALRSGKLAGAGLDVYEKEPFAAPHPLFDVQNVVLTPHIASFTPGTRRRMAVEAAEEVLAVLDGKSPRWRVN